MTELQQASRRPTDRVWHCICRHPYTGKPEAVCGSHRKTSEPGNQMQILPAATIDESRRCQRQECRRRYAEADEAAYKLLAAAWVAVGLAVGKQLI